jgi:hypothetical protein
VPHGIFAEEALMGVESGGIGVVVVDHLAKSQDVPLLPAAPVCCFNRE